MRNKWSSIFVKILGEQNVDIKIINTVNGWIEKLEIRNKIFFVKSASYNTNRNLYFSGIDKNKINDTNDYMLVCGGFNSELIDIFIIPWEIILKLLNNSVPINTYKLPKEYLQYKFYIIFRNNTYTLSFEKCQIPHLKINQYRYWVENSIDFFRSL